MMEPAWEAILGQSSEHSLATGPVIPDPFISPLGLTMTPALSIEKEMRLGTSLLTFEVEEIPFSSSVGLSLSNDDCGEDLLSQFWLTLPDGGEEQLSN